MEQPPICFWVAEQLHEQCTRHIEALDHDRVHHPHQVHRLACQGLHPSAEVARRQDQQRQSALFVQPVTLSRSSERSIIAAVYAGDLKMSSEIASHVRTRAFARVLGPYMAIVTAIIVYRAPALGDMLAGFFSNAVIVWMLGALLLISGIITIAFHQYWGSLAAVLISLFGWFLALRGAMLMAIPKLIERGVSASAPHPMLVQVGFSILTVIGLYLTYIGWVPAPKSDAAT